MSARPGKYVELFDGANNCGEASLDKGEEQASTHHVVKNFQASSLPPCDILKVDAEGAELEILEAYPHLNRCSLVLLEAHGESDMRAILKMMRTYFNLPEKHLEPTMKDRWTLCFKHNEVT